MIMPNVVTKWRNEAMGIFTPVGDRRAAANDPATIDFRRRKSDAMAPNMQEGLHEATTEPMERPTRIAVQLDAVADITTILARLRPAERIRVMRISSEFIATEFPHDHQDDDLGELARKASQIDRPSWPEKDDPID